MASDQLDKLWDGWMATLSDSYVKAYDQLKAGQTAVAAGEFHDTFTPTVKKLYSEAAQTYPVRYSKSENWCIWTKNFYIQTMKLDTALGQGNKDEALKMLAELRVQINNLHQQSQVEKSNDLIYTFQRKLERPEPAGKELGDIAAKLAKAEGAAKARADATAYEQARTAWARQVSAALQDGKLDPAQLETLRAGTAKFYHDYGMQFE